MPRPENLLGILGVGECLQGKPSTKVDGLLIREKAIAVIDHTDRIARHGVNDGDPATGSNMPLLPSSAITAAKSGAFSTSNSQASGARFAFMVLQPTKWSGTTTGACSEILCQGDSTSTRK